MQHRIRNRNGAAVGRGLVLTSIGSQVPAILHMYELSSPNESVQGTITIESIGWLDDDPETDTGVVTLRYGRDYLITLTYALEEPEESLIYYTIKENFIISTIFIQHNREGAHIRTLIAIPSQDVAIRR
jgi:hypothetical protein